MNELVIVRHGEVFTDSIVVSNGTGVEHRKIKDQIRKYQLQIEELGLLALYQAESTGGRPEQYYELSEPQATFLITLLKNNPVVVKFKLELVKQFYQMRLLLQGGITVFNSPIETRLTAIEQRLGIADTFQISNHIPLELALTDAINEALGSGGYYLCKRGRHHQEIPEGKTLLGAYDGNYYYIISQRAYELYAAKQETPVIKKGLYAYLLNGGFIEPNTEKSRREGYTTQAVTIKSKNYHCLVFYADRISFAK